MAGMWVPAPSGLHRRHPHLVGRPLQAPPLPSTGRLASSVTAPPKRNTGPPRVVLCPGHPCGGRHTRAALPRDLGHFTT
eukprot:1879968-Alexandrium_andersonii.AAC.1